MVRRKKLGLEGCDWTVFWLVEVFLLAVPTLITVIVLRSGPNLSLHRTAALILVLIGLTSLNLVAAVLRAVPVSRSYKR